VKIFLYSFLLSKQKLYKKLPDSVVKDLNECLSSSLDLINMEDVTFYVILI